MANTRAAGMTPERAQRAARVVELKDTGHSFYDIAGKLGVSYTQVRNDYKAAINAIYAETVEERVGKVERNYLRLLAAWWLPAIQDGDHKAAGIVMDTLKAYRELFGLDKALKLDATSNPGDAFATLLNALRDAPNDDEGPGMNPSPGPDLSDDAARLPDEE